MDCAEFLGRYSDWRDGLVAAPRERRRFERHVARCAPCERYDASVRRGVLALHAAETIEPSAGFRQRLEARLARERLAVAEPVQPALPPRAGFAAALCVAIAVVLVAIEGASGARSRSVAGAPELPPVIFPKPVAQAGVPLVTFHDPRATVIGGNPNPYGTALVQPASTPRVRGPGR